MLVHRRGRFAFAFDWPFYFFMAPIAVLL